MALIKAFYWHISSLGGLNYTGGIAEHLPLIFLIKALSLAWKDGNRDECLVWKDECLSRKDNR